MKSLQELLQQQLASSPGIRRIREFAASAEARGGGAGRRLSVKGLRGASLGGMLASLARPDAAVPAPPLVFCVTANDERSGEIYDDLQFFGARRVFHFPKYQVLPYDEDEPLLEEQVKHLDFLHALSAAPAGNGDAGAEAAVCVASVEALMTRVAPLEVLRAHTLTVRWGEPLDTEEFAENAAGIGYARVPTVEARGEFAVRGGIVDIFPLDADNPLRIDLFGTEIESIREFDVHTQRSLKGAGTTEELTVLPASERVVIHAALAGRGPVELGELVSAGREPHPLPTVLDILPAQTLVVLDGTESFPVRDERFVQLVRRQFEDRRATAVAGAEPLPPEVVHVTLAGIEAAAARFAQVHHSLIIEGVAGGGATVAFQSQSFETVKPSLEHYLTHIRQRQADGYTVAIVCDNDGQVQRMDEMMREHEIPALPLIAKKGEPPPRLPDAPRGLVRDVALVTGLLHSGFVLPEANLFLVTDREIFGRYKRRHVYRKIYKGAPVADAREIRKGDFVVHLEHGVGRFEGIRTQSLDGRVADLLEITYSDGDKLLVPTEKIAFVHKFSGTETAAPTLDKLGGKKWIQRRKKSQEDIEKLAQELLQLYARRSVAEGRSCGPDTPWQREFEASFLYTETPDQLRAIEEVKRDLAADKPMDRLVCGDVGYGKTEVAIRAAFKAIQDDRQVALLCPTTILCQQHYNTFRERFADYPIRVEMLSRFVSPAEAKKVMADVKAGKVNMLVGTHALISKSMGFKNLGLVIVDEEQRFGVKQKERLKELRASVDFLTLTATPIPRTLYMALSGLRDMSVINTPPADRHPIKTKIIHWEREQIEEAILRELNRGGQVYFVHNRVHNIHDIAERLREIVPSARIAIAHGQMNDDDLEQIMLDFIDRRHDILLSTTIIESGMDIPNVNTIIINRADAFGLAQLYQIRGRVGRENRRAYAYLIVPAGQAITEQAVARLAAIEEFTELGVGFNIAMRDMEIRGAGNLLGKEQHGSMNSIGFELYCRLLEDAVKALRGQGLTLEDREVEVQWKTSAVLPGWYVPVESQRVMLYKRIAEAATMEEIDEIADEIRDRYGDVRRGEGKAAREDLPAEVENLCLVAKLRQRGSRLGLRRISASRTGFVLQREGAVAALGASASQFLRKEKGVHIYTDNPDALDFHFTDHEKRNLLAEAVRAVSALEKERTA